MGCPCMRDLCSCRQGLVRYDEEKRKIAMFGDHLRDGRGGGRHPREIKRYTRSSSSACCVLFVCFPTTPPPPLLIEPPSLFFPTALRDAGKVLCVLRHDRQRAIGAPHQDAQRQVRRRPTGKYRKMQWCCSRPRLASMKRVLYTSMKSAHRGEGLVVRVRVTVTEPPLYFMYSLTSSVGSPNAARVN